MCKTWERYCFCTLANDWQRCIHHYLPQWIILYTILGRKSSKISVWSQRFLSMFGFMHGDVNIFACMIYPNGSVPIFLRGWQATSRENTTWKPASKLSELAPSPDLTLCSVINLCLWIGIIYEPCQTGMLCKLGQVSLLKLDIWGGHFGSNCLIGRN
jgi:hypothetical protein